MLFICDNVIPHEKRFGDKLLTKILFTTINYFIVQSKTVENDLKLFNKKNKPYILSPHPLYNIFGEKVEKKKARDFINKNYNLNLDDDNVILFFGFVRKYKGLMYLLDAMPEILKHNKIKLIVAGEFYEDEKPYKEKIIKSRIENEVFILSDFMPDEMVKYFFSACDCLVLPYTDATQSGIIQIAYYYDKPVIATDVGGLAEVIINEKTGILIQPEDSKAISDAVLKYFNENLEQDYSENIKLEKTKYSWETFVGNIEKLVAK